MEARETIRCTGHPLVRGNHQTTFEVTKETHLTLAGDCIIGICAEKGARDLSLEFREAMKRDGAQILTRLVCGDISVEIHGYGSSQMTLDHPTDLVWRRSTFVCGRTIAIQCDAVAVTLPRELISALKEGKEMTVEIVVMDPR